MPRPIFAIYSFILLFLVQIGENVEYLPLGNCQEAQEWQLNGRELVRDYKGRVLLLTFISLKKCNPECELTFSKLDSLHDHLSSIRVLAISPKNESPPSELRTFAWRFPRIRFERENEISPIWSWFNATHLDQFIFDRCSRHSSKLSASNQTSPPSYSSTLHSLKTALSAQPCGLCEYDPAKPLPKWPSLHPPIPMKTKIEDVQIGKTPPKTPMIMVNSGLMTSFSLEIGSPKDRIGAPKQLAFAEQRAVGSNHNSRQRDKSSKYQQRLPYGGREQNQQPLSVAVHSYPPQQQQPQSPPQPYPRPQNNPQQHLNSQPQITQQQLQRQREELARIQQQQMERERLLREHEERLRQRQLMEEQQRRYWAEQQERQRQIQQQHFATSPTAPPPLHPQHQQNEPIQQNQQPPQQKMRQIQQPAPVHYANDPYGDRYRFGLGRANNNNQRIGPNQQQRAHHQQQQRPIPMPAAGPADQSAMRSVTPQNPPTNVGFQSPQIMTPSVEPAPLYPEGSENDYYGYDDEWTTEMPSMMQIPRPTKQTAPTTPSIQQDKNFGFELPCTGFSDESCFQQQTQLRPNEVHRCCRGRILFTDQCIHGKCSNMTTQLCCIQRFLQAKLTCCSDERQAETGIGDHFSRCCFDNFVDSDDPCCPREYASEQWRSVHELCLPNVEMDLSAVKVPVPLFGTSLITEFDFSKTDKWRFECRYGGHVQQYSFFEKSASEEDESEGGGEID